MSFKIFNFARDIVKQMISVLLCGLCCAECSIEHFVLKIVVSL
jgi:hypothetical protein